MYRLYEITKKADTDTQRIVEFDSYVEVRGEYETRLANAMKATDEDAHLLMVLDIYGKAVCKSFVGEGEIAPRLIDTKVDTEGEHPNMAKYETVDDVHANYHMKYGNALKNASIKAIMLLGLDTKGNPIEYVYEVIDRESIEAPTTE